MSKLSPGLPADQPQHPDRVALGPSQQAMVWELIGRATDQEQSFQDRTCSAFALVGYLAGWLHGAGGAR